MMSRCDPSAYTMWLSLVAKDMVSRFTFCSKPPPMPKAIAWQCSQQLLPAASTHNKLDCGPAQACAAITNISYSMSVHSKVLCLTSSSGCLKTCV